MKKLALTALFVASLAGSYIAGVKVGGEANAYSDLTLRGVSATYYLNYLKAGDLKLLNVTYEGDIDNAKWAYAQLQSPIYTYSARAAGIPLATDDPKYIARINAHEAAAP